MPQIFQSSLESIDAYKFSRIIDVPYNFHRRSVSFEKSILDSLKSIWPVYQFGQPDLIGSVWDQGHIVCENKFISQKHVQLQASSRCYIWAKKAITPPKAAPEPWFSVISPIISGLFIEAPQVRFNHLAAQWIQETAALSSPIAMAMNPNYQQIIGMGPDVVPLILQRLSEKYEHWFWALEAITAENPIHPEHVGYVKLMAQDWLNWGIVKGLYTSE